LINKEEYERLLTVAVEARVLSAEVDAAVQGVRVGSGLMEGARAAEQRGKGVGEQEEEGVGEQEEAGTQGGDATGVCSSCQRKQSKQAWEFEFDDPLVRHGQYAGTFKGRVRLERRLLLLTRGGATNGIQKAQDQEASMVLVQEPSLAAARNSRASPHECTAADGAGATDSCAGDGSYSSAGDGSNSTACDGSNSSAGDGTNSSAGDGTNSSAIPAAMDGELNSAVADEHELVVDCVSTAALVRDTALGAFTRAEISKVS
jgi:hypothetical protein